MAKWAGRKAIMGTIFRSWMFWVGAAVFAAFVALWIHDRHLYKKINDPETGYLTQIAQSAVHLSVCEGNNEGLRKEIAKQNASIDQWKQQGDILQGKIDGQIEIIEKLQRDSQSTMDGIDDEVVVKTCEAAMSWLLQKALEYNDEK